MSTPASDVNLLLRYVFGFNCDVTDNLSYTDDNTLSYIAGEYPNLNPNPKSNPTLTLTLTLTLTPTLMYVHNK